ncbi:MAG: mechanosensitive ion channel, partial [Clostridia bacterium]|nr:mechanosensitive ion channel [Clostridia bacterium]
GKGGRMQFFKDLGNSVYSFLMNRWSTILTFVLVLIIGAIALRIVMGIFRKAINKSKLKGAAGDFLTSMVKVVLVIVYLIALLSLLGVPTTSIVAIFTAFSLALSLAVQGTISNVASGIMLVVNKPFEEGDFVDIGGQVGTVETITISCTKLKTGDNKVIVLPNSTVSGSSIINYSAKETRRLDLTFSVAYGSDVEKVKAIVLDVISKHSEILTDPAPMIRLAEHGASSLDFVTRVWVMQADYWNVNFDLKEEVLAAFDANGISVPFPQLDVHMVK